MATRTRQEYLKDLASNYATQTTIDSGSKFGELFLYLSILLKLNYSTRFNLIIYLTPIFVSALFASKKKLSVRPRFSPDASLRGALSWAVVVEDCSTNTQLEAFIRYLQWQPRHHPGQPAPGRVVHHPLQVSIPIMNYHKCLLASIVIPIWWPSVSNGLYRIFPPPTSEHLAVTAVRC